MKKIILFCLIFFTGNCFARQGYIITLAGDTLTGDVVRGNLNRNFLVLKSDSGDKKVHLRDIKEWKNGNMPVTVVPITTGKREAWLELLLVIDGKKRLYRDLFHAEGTNIRYTEHDGKYMQLTKQNIVDHLWDELLACKPFSEKYGHFNKKRPWKIQKRLEEIFRYYNSQCLNY